MNHKKKEDIQVKSFEKLVMLLVGPVLSGLGNGVRFSDLLILILHVEGDEL